MNGGSSNGQRWPDVDAKGANDGGVIAMGNGSNSALDGKMTAMGNDGSIEG
jgi:hypothetical protein